MRCDVCGAETEKCTPRRRSFRLARRMYCPFCWDRAERDIRLRSSLWTWGILAAVLGVDVVLVPSPLPKDIALILVLVPLCLALHEVGHAVAGWVVGCRVLRVCVGWGPTLGDVTWLGAVWEIRAIPWAAVTLAPTDSARWFRLRSILVLAAGPAVNLLLGLLAWHHRPFLVGGVSVGDDLVVANAWLLFWSLWPRSGQTAYGRVLADALGIVRALRLPDERVARTLAGACWTIAMEHLRRGEVEEARRHLEAGVARHPGSSVLRMALGGVLADGGNPHAARTELKRALEDEAASPEFRWLVMNNLAWTGVETGDPGLLEEADRLSKEAYEGQPWWPHYAGTRGSVLVERGRAAEGVPLLRRAVMLHERPASKAPALCYLAIGEAQIGAGEAARAHLEEARKVDAKCRLLARAEARVAGGGS